MGRFSKKVGRTYAKTQAKIALLNERRANRVNENVNSVANLLERSKPMMERDIMNQCMQQILAMSFMSLHDVFGFGEERIKRYYKQLLEIQHAALTSGSKTPYEDVLIALQEEYTFDLNKALDEVNAELDNEWKAKETVTHSHQEA